jgi:hypothetical protein
MSRNPKLNTEQVEEVRRRYRLHVENQVKRIAADFGIGVKMVARYVHGRHKRPYT